MSDPWQNYDAWKTTNPADEAKAEYEEERDRLAQRRGCSADDISDDELDEYLAGDADAKLAALEDKYDRERER